MLSRKSTRLSEYDYSAPGYYFITICTSGRDCLFGEIIEDIIFYSVLGGIAEECLIQISQHYATVRIDEFVIMPDHVHAIMRLGVGEGHAPPLHTVIGSYKSAVTKRIRDVIGIPDHPVWQRSFHDRIIRNEIELNELRTYIKLNPLRWSLK